MSFSYPEGNFGWNQLLGDSMSLSPLHPGVTSDLHVSTIGDPPTDFRLSSITPGEDRHLSGLSKYTRDASHSKAAWPVLRPYYRFNSIESHMLAVAFTSPRTVIGLKLVYLLNSLVRVSRRVMHFRKPSYVKTPPPKSICREQYK